MGKFTPRPYKKKCRITGQWVLIKPVEQEYSPKNITNKIKTNSHEYSKTYNG